MEQPPPLSDVASPDDELAASLAAVGGSAFPVVGTPLDVPLPDVSTPPACPAGPPSDCVKYGGRQILAGSAVHELLPSELTEQTPFGLSPQVQPAGQLWSALQATTVRLQVLVPLGAQLQSGGGVLGVEPESAGGAGSGALALADGAGAGVGVPASALPLLALPLLAPLALPEPAVPLPLAHVHDCSTSHVKPTPQSASAWHGTRYLGTHAETCGVVHVGSVGGGHF